MQRGGAEAKRIRLRLLSIPLDDIATTIVTYEEQMRGWLGRIARASTLERQIADYGEIKNLLLDYCSLSVQDFDARAGTEFQRLRSSKIRIGTLDLKIAAIALSNNATLLTRNAIHFSRVSGFRIEDWSL